MKSFTQSPKGKLGILTVGVGAISSTFMAGVMAIKKGTSRPIGSVALTGDIETEQGERVRVSDYVELAQSDDIVFGGWDVFEGNAYDAAARAKVLGHQDLESSKEDLEQVKVMPAVFNPHFVKFLEGDNVKKGKDNLDLAYQLREDIRTFKKNNNCDRVVVVWCGSTESYTQISEEHMSIEAFEKALKNSSSKVAPSMIYAYAAIMEGAPYANGAPNLSIRIPALQELAEQKGIPLAGSDFKTGQTLLKNIIAPGLKSRMLGISGWFSTNILGNLDGKVLQSAESFKSKEESKLGVLDNILDPEGHPELYGDLDHAVRINYYRPRGDSKEGWDNIDIFGWMGYPMQIKVNFLCRDSILAAPLVYDLAVFLDLASRKKLPGGIQEWLGFYFKDPAVREGSFQEHDLAKQLEFMHAKLHEMKR